MPKSNLRLASRPEPTVADELAAVPLPEASPRLSRTAQAYLDVQAQIKSLDEQKRVLGEKLLRLVDAEATPDAEGKVKLASDGCTLTRVTAERRTIDAKALLQLGVKQRIIAQATKTSKSEYVLVTPKKDKSNDD